MSLDPLFQKHLDNMRALQDELKADVEKGFQELNLDEVLQHPEAELTVFAEGLSGAIFKKFTTKFMAEGVRFGDEMKNVKRQIEASTPETVGNEQ